jgi:hypothetical protein
VINISISLALGLAVFAAVRLGGFPLYAGAIPATIVFLGAFVVLGRRTFTQIQKLMADVQAELQKLPPNAKERKKPGRGGGEDARRRAAARPLAVPR